MNTNKEMKSVWLWLVVALAIILFALLFWLMRGIVLPEIGNVQNVTPVVTNELPQVNQDATADNQSVDVSNIPQDNQQEEASDEDVVNPDDTVPGEPLDPALQDIQ